VGITFIFVTHDQEEAMALSDRIALLRNGLLEQVAAPREIYGQPATAYAAQFIGQTNVLYAEVRDGIAHAGVITWRCSGAAGKTLFSVRPECILLVAQGAAPNSADNATARFRGRIRNQTFGGAMDLLEIECGNSQMLRARIPTPGPLSGERDFEFSADDPVRVREGGED
jgi:ABC-type Fe3+/spermidine/putrescine transport system ATPase subunit